MDFGGFGGGHGGGGGGAPFFQNQQQQFRRRPRFDAAQQARDEYVPRVRFRGSRPVDLSSSIIAYLDRRKYQATSNNPFNFHVPPHEYYCKDVLPPFATAFNASTALCTQWAHTSQYPDTTRGGGPRRRVTFAAMKWSQTGRKLLCSTATGEFVLFNGASFTAEMKTQAHKNTAAVRALAWGPRSGVVISGDDGGSVKLWGAHFSLAASIEGNQRGIRDVCFCPSELRFCTGGQDGTCGIWDIERVGRAAGSSSGGGGGGGGESNATVQQPQFEQQQLGGAEQQQSGAAGAPEAETKLSGHGGDVHSVRWHPYRCLVATGSQDKDVRLWDPRTNAASIATLQGHGDTVIGVRWHELGRESWLLSAARDGTVRLWDTRMIRHEMTVYTGHVRPVTSVEWHPTHPDLFVSGGADGLVAFWMVSPNEGNLRSNGVTYEVSKFAAGIDAAHDKFKTDPIAVQCLAWSPMGHILATASSEVHIWTRNRPGALEEMRFDTDEGDITAPDNTAGTENVLGQAW